MTGTSKKPQPKSRADFPEFALADEVAARSEKEQSPRTPNNETNEEGADKRAKEVGGQEGPEPTRYGDWEKAGIATDF